MLLKVQLHEAHLPAPQRMHPGDAGLDLTAVGVERWAPRVYALDCGISVEPENGYYCELIPRSSLVRSRFLPANGVGIIDAGYRGRLQLVLYYHGPAEEEGEREARAWIGRRVAQLLVRRLETVDLRVVERLESSVRAADGFGSTG